MVWDTESGVMYYILVFAENSEESGIFGLEILEPNYDFCLGAFEVEIGDVYSGSTIGASYDSESGSGCGSTYDNGQAGVWFKVIGTGGSLVATTCAGSVVPWDSQIIVFDGDCNSLSCVNDNDDMSASFPCDYASSVPFSSTAGTTYYILVFGDSSDSAFSFTVA